MVRCIILIPPVFLRLSVLKSLCMCAKDAAMISHKSPTNCDVYRLYYIINATLQGELYSGDISKRSWFPFKSDACQSRLHDFLPEKLEDWNSFPRQPVSTEQESINLYQISILQVTRRYMIIRTFAVRHRLMNTLVKFIPSSSASSSRINKTYLVSSSQLPAAN